MGSRQVIASARAKPATLPAPSPACVGCCAAVYTLGTMPVNKEDFMPGQTKALDDKAADAEALKSFYGTLYKQRPDSEMAARWLLQHGLLETEAEAKALAKKFGTKTAAPKSAPKPAPRKKMVRCARPHACASSIRSRSATRAGGGRQQRRRLQREAEEEGEARA